MEVIATTNDLVKQGLAGGVASQVVGTWFEEYDLSAITEDVDLHLSRLDNYFSLLKMLVIDSLDPQYESLVVNLIAIERNVQELKAKLAIQHV